MPTEKTTAAYPFLCEAHGVVVHEGHCPDCRVRFCGHCGRQMIPGRLDDGFDGRTGERRAETVLVCPRFDRSWRNLWLGGWMHLGAEIVEDGQFAPIELDISWR